MNARPTREDILLDEAANWARRSTCPRLMVGSVIARDGHPVMPGYNGTVSGLPHCSHGGGPDDRCDGRAVHAEKNAIAFAARYGIATGGARMFNTHSPCLECAQLIVQAGIIEVWYRTAFRDVEGIALLHDAGVVTCHAS